MQNILELTDWPRPEQFLQMYSHLLQALAHWKLERRGRIGGVAVDSSAVLPSNDDTFQTEQVWQLLRLYEWHRLRMSGELATGKLDFLLGKIEGLEDTEIELVQDTSDLTCFDRTGLESMVMLFGDLKPAELEDILEILIDSLMREPQVLARLAANEQAEFEFNRMLGVSGSNDEE